MLLKRFLHDNLITQPSYTKRTLYHAYDDKTNQKQKQKQKAALRTIEREMQI